MKQKFKDQMAEIAVYKMAMQRIFLLLSIVMILLSAFFRINTIIPDLVIAGASYFMFYFSKDLAIKSVNEAAEKLKQFRYEIFTIVLFGDAALLSLIGLLGNVPIFATLFVLFISLICTAPFLYGKNRIPEINMFLEKDAYAEDPNNLTKRPGDAQIGVEKDTGKPIILPLKDRYLHMLVLGPTGCGKTSQILTPMVYDDIINSDLGIIVLEPKGDFAEKVYAIAKLNGKDAVYFNPSLSTCPYFNPLRGNEDDVIENITSTFGAFDADSSSFFRDINDRLLRNSLKVVKRLYGDQATFNDVSLLMNNVAGRGNDMIEKFIKLPVNNPRIRQENEEISHWFLDDYFTGISGGRNGTKTYENTSGIRNTMAKLISNSALNRVLNPPKGVQFSKEDYVDFADVLANGGILCLCSAQGDLRDLGSLLGYFLILSLESAVFRRPGNEDTRRGCVFYCDEFQKYANTGFSDMLTQGRSYRVASVLATQARSQIGMNEGAHAGNAFVQVVSTNARNIVLFPGLNADDAKYYSEQFGSDLVEELKVSTTKPKHSLFSWREERESISTQEREKSRIRATDITYKQFGEASVSLIVNNTLQKPRVAKLSFIPKAVNDAAGQFVAAFMAKQKTIENTFQENEDISFELSTEPETAPSSYSSVAEESGFEVHIPESSKNKGTQEAPLDFTKLGQETSVSQPKEVEDDELLG